MNITGTIIGGLILTYAVYKQQQKCENFNFVLGTMGTSILTASILTASILTAEN